MLFLNSNLIRLSLASMLLVVLAAGCSTTNVQQTAPATATKTVKPILQKAFGSQIKPNQPVILDFYTPFCLECQQMAPRLKKLVAAHPEIQLMTINVKNPTDTEKALVKAFKVTTVPHIEFIDATGKVQKTALGLMNDAELTTVSTTLRPIKP